jgi:hypothetical protein
MFLFEKYIVSIMIFAQYFLTILDKWGLLNVFNYFMFIYDEFRLENVFSSKTGKK